TTSPASPLTPSSPCLTHGKRGRPMTEQTTNAELIELAQDTLKRYGYGHLADAVEDQAAALEAAGKRAAEYAAVVEKVRANDEFEWDVPPTALGILATAPER